MPPTFNISNFAKFNWQKKKTRNLISFSFLPQTLDFALRVKCVATYGKIIAQDQSTIALFADGRASQYFNALEISAGRFLVETQTHTFFAGNTFGEQYHFLARKSTLRFINCEKQIEAALKFSNFLVVDHY